MTKPTDPGAYRDALAAAQQRIAVLEEELAEARRKDEVKGDEDEDEDEDGDDDPVIVPLLTQRRALEQTLKKRSPARIATVVLAGLVPLIVPLVPALSLAHPNYDRLTGTALICAVVGLVLAMGTDWLIRWGARDALPRVEAKIAEARRMRAIEQGLRARPSKGKGKGKAARARIAVEDEAAEDEAAEEEAAEEQAPRGRTRR